MTPRLAAITALVKPGASVIDVGTDHAYVPIHLVKEKKAERALATDINDGPLRRARENIALFGFTEIIKTKKANGLVDVDTAEYDTIIIAGMGGILISEILQGAAPFADKRLILQPMTAAPELRRFLLENGFRIEREAIVREEEKLYVILEAVCGQDDVYTSAELLLGRKGKTEPLYPHLKKQVEMKLRKRLLGLKISKIQQVEEIKNLENILRELSE